MPPPLSLLLLFLTTICRCHFIVAAINPTAEAFLGIKYASIPKRFSPSSLELPPTLTKSDFTTYGPDCLQPSFGPPLPFAPPQSEDCLYLNLWRPSPSSNTTTAETPLLLPVMVWIHGGGFTTGSGSSPIYDGSHLATEGNVIVITLNYRLGVFGLLTTDPDTGSGGMNAIGDQITALRWVQENIGDYGGDPQQVTIFGESIGGVSVCILSVSSEAEGLFRRAIVQSGQCVTDRLAPMSREGGWERTERLLEGAGLSSVEDLEVLDAGELLTVAGMDFSNAALDNEIMTRPPLEMYTDGPLNPKDMIVGSTTVDDPSLLQPPSFYVQRGTMFQSYLEDTFSESVAANLYQLYSPTNYGGNNVSAFAHFNGDFFLRCGGRDLASLAANIAEGNVYHYLFNQYTDNDIGAGVIASAGITDARETGWASHTTEIPFVFGNLNYTYLGPAFVPPTDAELALSREGMMPRWVGFARIGSVGEDWSPVVGGGGGGEERKIPTFVLNAEEEEEAMQYFDDVEMRCKEIPLYGEEETAEPTSVPTMDDSSSSSSRYGTFLGLATTVLVTTLGRTQCW